MLEFKLHSFGVFPEGFRSPAPVVLARFTCSRGRPSCHLFSSIALYSFDWALALRRPLWSRWCDTVSLYLLFRISAGPWFSRIGKWFGPPWRYKCPITSSSHNYPSPAFHSFVWRSLPRPWHPSSSPRALPLSYRSLSFECGSDLRFSLVAFSFPFWFGFRLFGFILGTVLLWEQFFLFQIWRFLASLCTLVLVHYTKLLVPWSSGFTSDILHLPP